MEAILPSGGLGLHYFRFDGWLLLWNRLKAWIDHAKNGQRLAFSMDDMQGNWRKTGGCPLLRISNYHEENGPFQTVWETFRLSLSFPEIPTQKGYANVRFL